MPQALSEAQIADFWRDGYLVAPNAVTPAQLTALNAALAGWIEDSRAHTAPFGPPTVDGRPRFDMGAEHRADAPALRRVNNPAEVSDAYLEVMRDAPMVDMVADLIGPNVKYHHCKLNIKLPGAATRVHYHQDFMYTPHSNDDVVTALLMLEDVDDANGCLMVAPGSHRGALDSLFQDGKFTGMVAADRAEELQAMQTRLQHGSEPNSSARARPLYICVYSAGDAIPLARNPMPSRFEGTIVRGQDPGTARMMPLQVELPKQPKSASFFTVQGQASAEG